ncbi:hypothetical protein TanjilG_12535 [Lupinus angustifolius]|uniref:RRM domain-containing protein n=1 Tax=Lupinus angustifolius TaxID=3871 RepID=A0A4P1QYW0_LUPAN|nr:PREDICTED: oligouridylate-binding protein 1-like [Lupinus angustifolius]OIV97778.1 hypothetical protein TanjilG_12535 [Lupinus angustifolius]
MQQEALMQQALLQQQQQQQQHMYHPGMLAAAASMSQMDPVPSGNLPPGFDTSACRSVYVGNINVNVTDQLLAEVFQSAGPLAGCKLIKKEKSSYGFVDYHDRASAALAIMTLHGRQLYGQALKVNWAYANSSREDTSGHFNVFVGDLSAEVTDATLFACFSVYPSCSDARVMWDNKTGRSKGYGFVSFRDHQDAQRAINDMSGKWLGNRQIRCNWATKGAGASSGEEKNNENQNAVVLTNGSSDGGQDNNNEDAPEKNPAYTTVYVGNLPHDVTQAELHCQFHALGAGVIEEVRVQRDKGFGFVRYNTHDEAALAILIGNGRIVRGKSMKCSWGSKPTPPGTASNPLPSPAPAQPYQILPAAGMNQGYSAAELLAYQRQLALSQAAVSGLSGQALLQMTGQHGLAPASMGINSGVSQAMYDGYTGNSSRQHLMYYH